MKLQERIEMLEKELAVLKASVVAQQVEWPSVDDSYWMIQAHGAIVTYRFCDDEFHRDLIQLGRCFRSQEEAKREVERLKVLTQLRKLAKAAWGGMTCNREVGMEKWYVRYAHGEDKWLVNYTCDVDIPGVVYFPTARSAYGVIETVGADHMMLLLEDWTSMKGAK